VLLPVVQFLGLPISGPVVQYMPVGSYVPAAVSISWQLPIAPVQLPRLLTPPSGTPSAVLQGSGIPTPVRAWWLQDAPLPQRTAFYVPSPVVSFPFPGPRGQFDILRAWDAQPYGLPPRTLRTTAGPVPSQPPLGGGASIPQAVLVNWIPPPPAPIVGSTGAVIARFGFIFLPSWHVAIVPPKGKIAYVQPISKTESGSVQNKTAVVPAKIKVVYVPLKNKTDDAPR